MATYVIDIETDSLHSTKIHVMSVGYKDSEGNWKVKSTNDYDKMKSIMSDPNNVVIGHNFKLFDAPELERVLDFEIKAEIIDTLALSWYIFPQRKQGTFGLGAFGEDYGVPKPKIEDWEGLTYEEYENRCQEDVKINIALWEDIQSKLLSVYESQDECKRFIKYLMFKMDCVVQQQQLKCKLDLDLVKDNMTILESIKAPKIKSLVSAMPLGRVIKSIPKVMYKESTKNKPKNCYKANGKLSISGENWFNFLEEKGLKKDTKVYREKTISSNGQKWFDYLNEMGLPPTTEEVREDANPSSTNQLKSWLFQLGWKPTTFKEGANGQVPQVRNADKQLCDSVLKLVDKEKAIEDLDGLTVINHRLGVLKAFLDTSDKDGYTIASMNGFTNTLRLKHSRPIANLPGVTDKINKAIEEGLSRVEAISQNLRDGQIIRECIVAPDGYELCGSDISSLEDMCKRHYMWDYDPEYVEEQSDPDFDPHLNLAVRAGAITVEQETSHKLYSETDGKEGVSIKSIRDTYKMVNYSAIYKVGAKKLSTATGKTIKECKNLLEAYWDRNWSIKQLPKDMTTKTVGDEMWLLNPVSKFWYSVRYEKDIFSTLNQGTGAFVFDCWLKFMMREGVTPFLQYHDEKLSLVKIGERDKTKKIIEESMEKVNKSLKLNVEIGVDVQFGNAYSDCH